MRPLRVAARDSPLSQAQVREVLREVFDPLGIPYEPYFVKTYGDQDLTVSLRTLDKTDFFTREVDALVLSDTADLAVHSAKDLPESLHPSLNIVALTEGQDPSDSLVMREGETLAQVHLVATSSERREAAVRALKPDVIFSDIRGPIHERLSQLERGTVDAVVVAEAALLRLNLHPNRLRLPGETAPLQGKLALVAKHGRTFPFLRDSRPLDTLYFGLRCPNPLWHHFPLIEIHPLPFTPPPTATHYLFTSRTAVELFFPHLTPKPIYAVGKATAQALFPLPAKVPSSECQEGLIELLEKEDLSQAHLVWPRSALSRDTLSHWLQPRVKTTEIPLYTTLPTSLPKIDLSPFRKLIFTSPSTVKAFLELYGPLPQDKELLPIGPITAKALLNSGNV